MNIAENYLKKQLASEEFKHSFLEEKVKLDIATLILKSDVCCLYPDNGK